MRSRSFALTLSVLRSPGLCQTTPYVWHGLAQGGQRKPPSLPNRSVFAGGRRRPNARAADEPGHQPRRAPADRPTLEQFQHGRQQTAGKRLGAGHVARRLRHEKRQKRIFVARDHRQWRSALPRRVMPLPSGVGAVPPRWRVGWRRWLVAKAKQTGSAALTFFGPPFGSRVDVHTASLDDAKAAEARPSLLAKGLIKLAVVGDEPVEPVGERVLQLDDIRVIL